MEGSSIRVGPKKFSLVCSSRSPWTNRLTILATNPWDVEAGTLHNDAWPLQLAFHSFDPHLAVTDDADNIW
jgi:hypothetical protein